MAYLASTSDDAPDTPNNGAVLNGGLPTDHVGKITRNQRSHERATRHRGSNPTLNGGSGTGAICLIGIWRPMRSLIEVAFVLISTEARAGNKVVSF